jgi:hypothetical protein
MSDVDDIHRFAVVSADFSKPFLLGAYPTLDRAVMAQCGSPEKWPIYEAAGYRYAPAAEITALREQLAQMKSALEAIIGETVYSDSRYAVVACDIARRALRAAMEDAPITKTTCPTN